MKQGIRVASIYVSLLSLFLLVEGTWGLFSPVVFGILTTNFTRAVIHIILGLIGLRVGLAGWPRAYCLFTGSLLLIIGILSFVPGANEWIVDMLNVNNEAAYLNIVAGVISLIMVTISKPQISGSGWKR